MGVVKPQCERQGRAHYKPCEGVWPQERTKHKRRRTLLRFVLTTGDYLAFTITLPPPSGSIAVLVPRRRQIRPLLSKMVIA